MTRSEFIKAALALPMVIHLPLIAKGKKKSVSDWSYEGLLEKEKKLIHLHFYKSPIYIQSDYKNQEIDLCIQEGDNMKKLPFSIKTHGGKNHFSKEFYWVGYAKPINPISEKYNFLGKDNTLTIGFAVENNKWYEAPLNRDLAYIFLESEIIAKLGYKDDFTDALFNADCFLTSACVFHKGLEDNCYQLTQLRKLREEFMRPHKIYSQLLQEYKEVAPKMLEKINVAENKTQILDSIYEQLVKPSVGFLEMGEKEKAVLHYTHFVEQMKQLYL